MKSGNVPDAAKKSGLARVKGMDWLLYGDYQTAKRATSGNLILIVRKNVSTGRGTASGMNFKPR